MLVSFSVSNFRSFGDEETLSMVASNKLKEHPEHLIPIGKTGKSVVRTGVLYGANAAGKSNLVRAMSFAQRMIGRERSNKVSNVETFRFCESTVPRPSTFEFQFLIDESVYVYGFDVSAKDIQEEWLTVVRDGNEQVIFERKGKHKPTIGDKRAAGSDAHEILHKVTSLPLRSDQLLLNRVLSLPEEVQGKSLRAVIKWLTHDLVVLRPDHRALDILDRIARDPEFKTFATLFMQSVGTGIGGFEIQEAERAANDIERQFLSRVSNAPPNWFGDAFGRAGERDLRLKADDPSVVIDRRLLSSHTTDAGNVSLPFGEESDGTQQLLHLIPVLASPSDGGRVVVLDELDRSLHPILCWEFIRFFSESCPGAPRQLVVTTHEAHLLNQDLLRRDEYWFVEKDKRQQSRLVPLSDFNVRNDFKVERGYLQGRFGAIPIIGSMSALEELLQNRLKTEGGNATQAPSA